MANPKPQVNVSNHLSPNITTRFVNAKFHQKSGTNQIKGLNHISSITTGKPIKYLKLPQTKNKYI